ncbi:ABC transporter permease subunit, partial [Klebsiella pneumoniae]
VAFIGYDPQRVRYLVFLISGGFAGLAGSLSAVNFEIITPEKLGALNSGAVLLMAYIGGAAVFFGPIIGAVLI